MERSPRFHCLTGTCCRWQMRAPRAPRSRASSRSWKSTAATRAKAFDYMKKLRPNVQLYTKSGGGGTLPVGLGQAGGGIFFIVDALDTKAKGYDVDDQLPQGRHRHGGRRHRADQGRQESGGSAKKLIDWATSSGDAKPVRQVQDQFRPGQSRRCRLEPSLAEVLKGAKIFAIDADYAGANRKRIVERWVAEVLKGSKRHRVTAPPQAVPAMPGFRGRVRRDPDVARMAVRRCGCCWALFVIYPLAMLLAGRSTITGRSLTLPASWTRWLTDRHQLRAFWNSLHARDAPSAWPARRWVSCSPSPPRAAGCRAALVSIVDASRAAASGVAAVHDRDRDHLLVRAARASSPTTCSGLKGVTRIRLLTSTLLSPRGADLFPDRLPDAAADPGGDRFEHRGHGVLAWAPRAGGCFAP